VGDERGEAQVGSDGTIRSHFDVEAKRDCGCAQQSLRPFVPTTETASDRSIQEGGETDGLPRLVDMSCEVGDGLCQDILCLVRWVGVRYMVGPSGVIQSLGTEKRGSCPRVAPREGTSRILLLGRVVMNTICVVWGDEHNPCVIGSTGLVRWSRVVGRR
jgi:hypothetical protein